MSQNSDDVVKVASGEHVVIELYRQRLADEGIEARVLGESLEASFGTALRGSVELWVHRADGGRAEALIRRMESDRGRADTDGPGFPRPADDPHQPHAGGHGPHTHYTADPKS